MRKLRSDITVDEFFQWAREVPNGTPWEAMRDLVAQKPCDDYPNSFYDPAIPGCFGRFWNPNSHEIWGHLHDVDIKTDIPYLCENGVWYQTFESGLPQDVDENGWPKEKDFKR